MKLRFCGVRGSTPAPGAEFVRVGGNTSCVAVTPMNATTPRLLLDAGTGIRSVTAMLGGGAFRGTILLSHLHWDHVQGLPFFSAGDRDDAIVRLLMPAMGEDPTEVLRRAMSPPHFPIGPEELRGEWSFEAIGEGTVVIEGLSVTAREIPHKGGRTFGFRVEENGRSFAYLPDHLADVALPHEPEAAALASGVDVLIHDSQFVTGEALLAQAYGHSTIDQAVEFAARAGVGELILFHHSPTRSDDAVDRIAASLAGSSVRVSVAVEGLDRTIA